MGGDWIKMHRKLIKSAAFQNAELLKLWIWCLLKAAHRPMWVPIKTGRGETVVELQPGQFIFGRHTAAKSLKMKPASVYKRLQKLEKLQNVSTQRSTHYTIVTVCNWARYNHRDSGEEQVREHPSSTQVATKYQPSSTNKKVQEGKELQEAATAPLTIELLSAKWNTVVGVRSCRKPTPSRRNQFKTRAASAAWVTQVDAALDKVARSTFCQGGGKQGWRADLDWFLKPETVSKIMEGKYDDNGRAGHANSAGSKYDPEAELGTF